MLRIIANLIFQGIKDITLKPFSQILTLIAISLVALLSGFFLITLVSFDYQLGNTKAETTFQVYWQPGVDLEMVKGQWKEFENLPGFVSIKSYTPADALKLLGERLGKKGKDINKSFPFLSSGQELPATALVNFVPLNDDDPITWTVDLEDYFRSLSGISDVVITPIKDELGYAWRQVRHLVMWPAIAFLIVIFGLIVGNTVRLSFISKADEIEILQLVGAKSWYIRLPLVVNGTVLGLLSGTLALVLLYLIYLQVYNILNFPPLFIQLKFLSWQYMAALLFTPAIMGALASWIAVHNKKI